MTKPNKHIVVLHSGGLDSTIMFELAKRTNPGARVDAVYFNIGHEYAWKEIEAVPPGTHIIDMTWFQAEGVGKSGNAMNSIFIPGRNMMLVTLAACKFMPDEIWLGALMGEIHAQATDKNLKYQDMQNELLDYVLSPFGKVRLVFPFVDRRWGKLDITRNALEIGMESQILASSSCMSGEDGNCGKCGVCLRRAGIFMQLGLSEPYNEDPWTAVSNRKMIRDMIVAELKNDDSHYDSYRRDEIIPALKMIHGTEDLEAILVQYEF